MLTYGQKCVARVIKKNGRIKARDLAKAIPARSIPTYIQILKLKGLIKTEDVGHLWWKDILIIWKGYDGHL